MTRIDFHVNAPDPIEYGCRVARKAYLAGSRAIVCCGEPARLAEFDTRLWTLSPDAFIPHVAADDPLAAETPVLLTRSLADLEMPAVLINLGPEVPAGFERFERMIEIVGTEASERAQGRQRFRHYRDQGHPLNTHDLSTVERS